MTALLEPESRPDRNVFAQAEGTPGTAMPLVLEDVLPANLLDGGEIVEFAIKPSLWYVPIMSVRWLAFAAVLAILAWANLVNFSYESYLYRAAILIAGARLAWGCLEWSSHLYVLTNRRVMRLHGVFRVELFECGLHRIQNTYLTLSFLERLMRIGTVTMQTAAATDGGSGTVSWRCVARPLEVHHRLREAILRAQNRGNHVL